MRDFALTIQLWVWLSMGLVGCAWLGFTPDESLDTRRCATHSALGCAAQAALYCTVRGPMDGFVGCIVEKSSKCAAEGIAGCLYATIAGSGGIGGGSGRDYDMEKVQQCCDSRSHDGRWGAVEMVAECYVDVCIGGQ